MSLKLPAITRRETRMAIWRTTGEGSRHVCPPSAASSTVLRAATAHAIRNIAPPAYTSPANSLMSTAVHSSNGGDLRCEAGVSAARMPCACSGKHIAVTNNAVPTSVCFMLTSSACFDADLVQSVTVALDEASITTTMWS